MQVEGKTLKKVTTFTPWSNNKMKIDANKNMEWENRWKSELRFKHTKLFYSKPDKNKAKGVLNLSSMNLIKPMD